jgi:hypothetical protein
MKSRWVEHKGKRIYISDYSNNGINSTAVRNEAEEVIKTLTKEPPNSVLSVTNVDGTKATRQVLQALAEVLPHTNEVVTKRAIVGATGLRWTFVDAFNKLAGRAQFNPFDSIEEALDWIVQD